MATVSRSQVVYTHPVETTRCNQRLANIAVIGTCLGAGKILAAYFPSTSFSCDAAVSLLSMYAFQYLSNIDADTGLDDYRLVEAANEGNRQWVKFLLFLGANPNVNPSNCALRNAIQFGDLEMAEDLLKAKANPDLRGNRDKTILMEAVIESREDVVKLLLKYKADPFLKARCTTNKDSHYYAKLAAKQQSLYRNNLKDREFDKKAPQNFCSEQATIAQRQGASENENCEAKPTQTNTDSSSYFGIEGQEKGKEATNILKRIKWHKV